MATMSISYRAAATLTITLAGLASSATHVAGRNGTAISNSLNKDADILLGGKITVGLTPVADTQIQIWAVAARDETPTWPDSMTGLDAAFTWSSEGVRNGAAVLVAVLQVDSATSNRAYEFSGVSLAAAFGGTLPDDINIFVTHDTGVALNATAGNHEIKYIGVTYTSA